MFSLFAILFLSTAGCEAAGAVAYKVHGPPAVAAKYTPDQQPMLVLVESYQTPGAAQQDAEMLGQLVTDELREHKVAPVVPAEKTLELRGEQPEQYRAMSIATIGRSVGAKQVLYIDLVQLSYDAALGSDIVRGRATVQVRIIDTASGETLWPKEAAGGYPVSYETPVPRADKIATEASVRQDLHRELAARVARLFYKWKPDDLSPQEL